MTQTNIPTKQRKVITYYYRGMIERGADYHWTEGWSENSDEGYPIYPWSTKRECQREATRLGARAEFLRDKTQQIA